MQSIETVTQPRNIVVSDPKVPPDLSLMARARGRGDEGARYIYTLLISYNDTPEQNSLFPNIAMPQPFPVDDPDYRQKAMDVAAFLYHAADPSADERKHLGVYVIGYMVVITTLLYILNRRTWKNIMTEDKTGRTNTSH